MAGFQPTLHGRFWVTPEEPDDVYSFMTGTLRYELSTVERWLKRRPPYTREEFENNWNHGPEYYFIATAARKTRQS